MAIYDNTNYKTCEKCGSMFFTENKIYRYELTSGNNLATKDVETKSEVIGRSTTCFACGNKELAYE